MTRPTLLALLFAAEDS